MKIKVVSEQIDRHKGEVIVVGLFEGQKNLRGSAAEVDGCGGGMIKKVLGLGDFQAKLYQTMLLYTAKGLTTKRVLLVGLGKENDFNPDRLRNVGATAARAVRDLGMAGLSVPLSFVQVRGLSVGAKTRALAEGIILGLYRFSRFKATDEDNGKKEIKNVTILVKNAAELQQVRTEIKRTQAVCSGTVLARDLVSRPSNSATPSFLARTARLIARKTGLTCKIIDEKQAAKLGMGSYLGVARGTDEPARFIIMEYKPKAVKAPPTVALVGKAVTFDSGGISLKPSGGMEEMKTDMAGGAAVLGIMQAVAELKLPVHVVGLVPATENLPSGHALKPGDIVTAMAGKTIEIISTDAEGRLILADALHYAQRYKPEAIVDLATLTGACVIALGTEASAVMGNDEKLIGRLKRAGETSGEKVWQLPLWDGYRELIKSDVADIKNVGGRPAGTITAGCFLKEFVGETPWAHLDIAGTAWLQKPKPAIPKGASGVGVRLLIEMLENW